MKLELYFYCNYVAVKHTVTTTIVWNHPPDLCEGAIPTIAFVLFENEYCLFAIVKTVSGLFIDSLKGSQEPSRIHGPTLGTTHHIKENDRIVSKKILATFKKFLRREAVDIS